MPREIQFSCYWELNFLPIKNSKWYQKEVNWFRDKYIVLKLCAGNIQ